MALPKQVFLIERSLPGQRLDAWLRLKVPNFFFFFFQRLIEEGHILVNGKRVKSTHTPRAG